MGLEPASVSACVRACVHTFKHEYLRDQQADYNQIWFLVSMATDSSHRVIMGEKGDITFSRLFLYGSFLYLQVTMKYIRACMSSKFGQIRPRTTELAALERRKKFP